MTFTPLFPLHPRENLPAKNRISILDSGPTDNLYLNAPRTQSRGNIGPRGMVHGFHAPRLSRRDEANLRLAETRGIQLLRVTK